MPNNTLVLVPTYNERSNLSRLLPRLAALTDVEVLVIDDSSPDGTGRLAEKLRHRFPRLSVLHRSGKEGLGPAYRDGFRYALDSGYRHVVTMDADLSHDPADVPRLVAALREADIAIGSRYVAGGYGAHQKGPTHAHQKGPTCKEPFLFQVAVRPTCAPDAEMTYRSSCA